MGWHHSVKEKNIAYFHDIFSFEFIFLNKILKYSQLDFKPIQKSGSCFLNSQFPDRNQLMDRIHPVERHTIRCT